MTLLHVAILSPFIIAILVPFLHNYFQKIHTGWFILPLPILLFVYFLSLISSTMNGETIRNTASWIPSLGINFTAYIDGLGLLFALLITGIGALVILYSIYYLSKVKEQLNTFYVYLLLFMGAMLGVVLSDNLIVLYTFWELTSLSSFLLIGYWYEREKSRYGAQKSMMITIFGGLLMLGGFIMLYMMTNTFSIREIIEQVPTIAQHHLFIPALILILFGAFTKSAQFPFYIWLPDAMEAPTPVSAYLHSATMVKAGIYLVARFSPVFAGTPEWFWIVSAFGIFTMFWGSFNAIKQTDLKGILAFSTVSQLGMIMSMLGVGSAAIALDSIDDSYYTVAILAAMFHLMNHATFKGSLFMIVGIIDHETGTRDIRKLGGLMGLMPITFTISIIGAFSMAGLPPFNGFLSKEMFFSSMIRIVELNIFNLESLGLLFPIVAWVGSIFTFIYSMVLVFKTFTGKYQPEKLEKKPHEAPIGMLISPIILASLVIVFFFFPNLLAYTIIEPAMASIIPAVLGDGEHFHVHISPWHGFTLELYMTIGVVALGILGYFTLRKWSGIYRFIPERLTINKGYDAALYSLDKSSFHLTRFYMTGSIRNYLLYIFTFFIVILGTSLAVKGGFSFSLEGNASVGIYEVILAGVILIGTITSLFAKSRLTSIIALGSVGYTVSLFFVLFRAPDLALTQLSVETVSVALFLLCFYHLPEFKKPEKKLNFNWPNFIISLGVGTIVSLLALSANSQRVSETISTYFIENSYKLAGGKNMVNVILVDFRGFDTLFEITVLGIASLGIFGMIRLQVRKEEER
ncbi:Na+/H+ antiporter subunit A [Metabacillus sediminilitoris]|uniref:Na+/H+ antiporter subunit A n=1 Tax=Metabacillus sediminilitoris TaxID=2567941 RepID=A0A4S4C0R8_9BACI|nr:Na+/H+ antiporter subunit A [Metabacillus sediminilitoris]QGQ47833.1 Na+/H+ antiporter subunit A [Metabacillus sediminilitoris]THF81054.1 Na+/H+ antiporter subunit A [Metabacillus sediminilitoris]